MTKAADALHRTGKVSGPDIEGGSSCGAKPAIVLAEHFPPRTTSQRDVESRRFDVLEEFVSGGRLKRGPLRGFPLALCLAAQSQERACAPGASGRRSVSLRSRRRG